MINKECSQQLWRKSRNLRWSKRLFLGALLFSICGICPLLGRLSEDERQLNANIRAFTPIFTETENVRLFSFNELEREERLLEKAPLLRLKLVSSEEVSPQVRDRTGGHFLGYSNEATELSVILTDAGELFRPLAFVPMMEGRYEFDFELWKEVMPLEVNKEKPVKFNVVVDIQVKRLPIRVTDSRKVWRTYEKAKVYWVDVEVNRVVR